MNKAISQLKESYEQYAYLDRPYPETAIEHLEVLGKIRGINVGDSENSNVLELGCASGGNLIPMAWRNPESRFLGIDLSTRQIEKAQVKAKSLGLTNIEFWAGSFKEFKQEKKYDYVVAHGLFSWIPLEQQSCLLGFCSQMMSSEALLYLSFNCYPGWHLKNFVRDVLSNNFDRSQAEASLRKSVEFLELTISNLEAHGNPMGPALLKELNELKMKPPSFLLHDELETENHPLFFKDFIKMSSAEGLSYLCDSLSDGDLLDIFPVQTREYLNRENKTGLELEQLTDFLRARKLRRAVLYKSSKTISEKLILDSDLFVLSDLQRRSSESKRFESPQRGSIQIENGDCSQALGVLRDVYPCSIQIEDLFQRVKVVGSSREGENLKQELLRLFRYNLIDLLPKQNSCALQVSEKPSAYPLARALSQGSLEVCNSRHQNVVLNEEARRLLQLLDGSRSLKDLQSQVSSPNEVPQVLESFRIKSLLSE